MRAVWLRRLLVVPAALVLDSLALGLGERESLAKDYERILHFAEEILWTDTIFGGIRFAMAGAALPFLAGRAVRLALGDFGSEAVAGAACVGLGHMRERAVASAAALEQEGPGGGAAPGDVSPARAAVESIATSFAQDVCGSLLYLNVAGADGLLAYAAAKAIGARAKHAEPSNARFGVVPGGLGIALGWLPSRAGALAVCAAAQAPTLTLYAKARRDAMAHPSPNAGIVLAAFAHALGIGLGADTVPGPGPSRYRVGTQVAAATVDIRRALALAERAAVLMAFWLMAADAGLWLLAQRRPRVCAGRPPARRPSPP
ncbi:MAG: cobalamin biosynthesis protein [Actinomycetota bacterium]|nr:cobalamin biosynthesis protein [Actinomycetota bacterium]